MAASNKHWFPELLKDRFVKVIFKIILTAIALFVIFIVVKAFLGYNVNFFGIETNPNSKKPKEQDVVLKPPPPAHIDSPKTISSIKTERPKNIVPTNTTEKKKPELSKKTGNVQNIDSGGSGVQNNGINNGQQAGRDINNFGIIPRKINEADLIPYINQLQDRSVSVRFISYGFADAEINSVKNQIIAIMKKHGFNNIDNFFRITIGVQPPKGIVPIVFKKENILVFHIPPSEL